MIQTKTEIELLADRIRLLNSMIAEIEDVIDVKMGALTSARNQRDRAIKRVESIAVSDAVKYPSFLVLEAYELANN